MLPYDHDVVATCRRADARRLADTDRPTGPIATPATTDRLRTHVGALLVRTGHRLQAPHRSHPLGRAA